MKDIDTTGAEIARVKLWEFAGSRSGIAMILLAFLLVIYFISSIAGCVQDAGVDKQIEKGQSAVSTEIKRADGQTEIANGAAVERRVEDQIREKTIEPRRSQARERSRTAEIETENARLNYEKAKNNPHLSRSDIRVLDERVCSEYRELYPAESIAGCAR